MIELIRTIEVHNELGEGVIWDAEAGVIWWTDIQGKTLYQYSLTADQLNSWDTPERLCCCAPIEGKAGLVVAFESGFAFYQPETGQVDWIHKLETDNPGTRFNDGRTDRQGRFWSGTMVEDRDSAIYQGSLYCLASDLSTRKTLHGLTIPNSLCWSPDGTLMYHTDTPSQTINRYNFNIKDGTIESGTTDTTAFIHTSPGCYPDGSTVDAAGYLWNAQWGGGKIVRYAPDGKQDISLAVPTQQPSCVAFGGANLDLLIVTSAHQSMTPQQRKNDPDAGNLFIYQTEFKGLQESRFKVNTGNS